MTEMVFVDTNVLVYARDPSDGEKHQKAWRWVMDLWNSRAGRVSYQVLHEYYLTVTQRLDPGLTKRLARADVRSLMTWRPVPLDSMVLDGAWTVQDRYGFSFWDSLVVSAARQCRSTLLLTEDLHDGQDLDGLMVINPFETAPDSIL